MNNTIKAALITGVATIIAGFIGGMGYGKLSEQKNIQNEIQSVMGNVINVTGNDNEVTINSIKDLIDEYQRLQSQNKSLLDQNSKYFSDLTEANYQVNTLQSFTNDIPEINFNNLSLSIDVQDIPINKNNSMVTIDGRDYFSREIVESLIPDNKNMVIKDNTIFIGSVVKNKENLFKQNIFDQSGIDKIDAITDSYKNNYSDVLCTSTSIQFNSLYTNYITYNLDAQYSYLKFSIAVRENADPNSTGILTVKADEEVVYTSETLNKKTKVFATPELYINNCDLLRIEYTPNNYYVDCIISNAIVYN